MQAVEEAWADVAAPPLLDLQLIGSVLTQQEADAFVDVPPMDVDIDSADFLSSEPLLELPPEAAAAYLGTFLRAVMRSLHEQKVHRYYGDALTRAHLLNCLTDLWFWQNVVEPHVTGRRLEVLLEAMGHMIQEQKDLGVSDDTVATLRDRIGRLGET